VEIALATAKFTVSIVTTMLRMTYDAHRVVYNDATGYTVASFLFHAESHRQATTLIQVSSNSLLSNSRSSYYRSNTITYSTTTQHVEHFRH